MDNPAELRKTMFQINSTYNTDFDNDRTVKSDFYATPNRPVKRQSHEPDPSKLDNQKKPCLPKDVYTMTEYKHGFPFSLFWKPKEIIRTNPYDVQKEIDTGFLDNNFHLHGFQSKDAYDPIKNEIRRTRPRMAISPAICMDDATAEIRDHILESFYKSSYKSAFHVEDQKSNVVSPLGKVAAPAVPIQLRPHRMQKVEPEWRWESIKWDDQMLRAQTHADYRFWKSADVYKSCRACKDTAQMKN